MPYDDDYFVDNWFYLHDYQPWKIMGQPNPNFTPISGRILDVKDNLSQGINFFAKEIEILLTTQVQVADKNLLGCVLPSHKEGKCSPGLTAILNYLQARGILEQRIDALKRIITVDKLAHGGNRDINIHLATIRADPAQVAGRTIVLLDDVTTTGNSMNACRNKLSKAGAKTVIGIALGKTVHHA